VSLRIDVGDVTGVLLEDGWHRVEMLDEGISSFDLDAYEFVEGDLLLHGGGVSGICSNGFTFHEIDENGVRRNLMGPLTSILAITRA